MKNIFKPLITDPETRRFVRGLATLLCCSAVAGLTACSFLKPVESTTKNYVLTPMPAPTPSAEVKPGAATAMIVGVGRVKIPAYLFSTSVVVRRGTNEVEYLPTANWAERLDTGFQRVLAANLAVVLPTERIHLSAWSRNDVNAELYVHLEQFDVDASGRGVLVARWRVVSPGGEKVLKAGGTRLVREGPKPDASPSGAIATLSELVAQFSREMAQALQETTSAPKANPAT